MKSLKQFLKEFFLITMSILIAFWIEDFREQRRDDAATKELLINIKQDILANEQILIEYASLQDTTIIPWMNKVLDDLRDCSIDSMALLLSLQDFTPVLNLRFEGYENLKNAGLLSNINDDTLLRVFKPMPLEIRYVEENEKYRALIQSKLVEIGLPIFANVSIESDYESRWKHNQMSYSLNETHCNQLNMLISFWINSELGYSTLMSFNAKHVASWLPRLEREIESK